LEHWFDEFTKRLALNKPSRRTFLGGIGAMFGLAAISTSWRSVLAAVAPGHAASMPAARSITFGPCSLATSPSHIERHFSGSTSAAGHAVTYKRSHVHFFDSRRGSTFDTTILLDGRPVLDVSSTTMRASTHYQMKITNAFGFKSAVLTSDDGKTMHGEIDGRALAPITAGSDKKLQYADGSPVVVRKQPDVGEAVTAAFDQANRDLGQCVAPAQPDVMPHANGHGRRRASEMGSPPDPLPTPLGINYFNTKNGQHINWEGPAACGAPMSAMNGNAAFNPRCVACGNKCTDNSNTCMAVNWGKCIACFFTGFTCGGCYELMAGCAQKDYACLGKCNVTKACLGQPI
jgi:hypothetical protein